jgi:multicomponent Na+:H+ antiporter subunit D
LRAAGRIFLGLGSAPGIEADAPTEEDGEKADRPLWLMLAPAGALIAIALLLPLGPADLYADTQLFMHPDNASILGIGDETAIGPRAHEAPPASSTLYYSWFAVVGALAIAALSLFRMRRASFLIPAVRLLQALHCAHVGDYAAWQCIGLAAFAVAVAMLP